MGMPKDKDARLFYRVAAQRLAEADDLQRLGYTTIAVYVGGYVIETMFKALLIEIAPRARRRDIVADFRGAKGHDLEYLRRGYYRAGGAIMPVEVARDFSQAVTWSTNIRYVPGAIDAKIAKGFLRAARSIFQWAQGRF